MQALTGGFSETIVVKDTTDDAIFAQIHTSLKVGGIIMLKSTDVSENIKCDVVNK